MANGGPTRFQVRSSAVVAQPAGGGPRDCSRCRLEVVRPRPDSGSTCARGAARWHNTRPARVPPPARHSFGRDSTSSRHSFHNHSTFFRHALGIDPTPIRHSFGIRHPFDVHSTCIRHSVDILSTFIRHPFDTHSISIRHSFDIHSRFIPADFHSARDSRKCRQNIVTRMSNECRMNVEWTSNERRIYFE